MDNFLDALSGPKSSEAGGLAALTTGAAGAALYLKCRFEPARAVRDELQRLAKTDGQHFADYQRAKRAGHPTEPALEAATDSPLKGAELSLDLGARFEEAKNTCPKSMISDLMVGRTLLLAAAQSCLTLAQANLECFPKPWAEGEARAQRLLVSLAAQRSAVPCAE